jgi:hypothetical protein
MAQQARAVQVITERQDLHDHLHPCLPCQQGNQVNPTNINCRSLLELPSSMATAPDQGSQERTVTVLAVSFAVKDQPGDSPPYNADIVPLR